MLRTPHIDAIAAEGVSSDRFYVASPVCMPNRASLMTCRMPSSHGVRSLGVPLGHENVTFVDLPRAAGYDTALIGKSHLQDVLDVPTLIEPPAPRKGFAAPPDDLAEAVRSDIDSDRYQIEQQAFWQQDSPQVPLPYYGFDSYTLVLRHGFNTGGNHERHVKDVALEVHALGSRDIQFPHDYICPQAIRVKIPEEHYSTSYVADRVCEYLESRRGNPAPFLLMVSFPDPHHPFTPPGKYWDMCRPEDMPVPSAYAANDWDPPDYVKIAERDRANDSTLGQSGGQTVAVSSCEAQEARADMRHDRDDRRRRRPHSRCRRQCGCHGQYGADLHL